MTGSSDFRGGYLGSSSRSLADRPVRSEQERAYLIAALAMVDAVVLFDEDTPAELVDALKPDVIVKGGDYRPEDVAGASTVLARGGRVVIIPLTAGHSTTATLAKLRTERNG